MLLVNDFWVKAVGFNGLNTNLSLDRCLAKINILESSSFLPDLTLPYLAAPSLGRLVPYLERPCFLFFTPAVSKVPRIM